MEKPDKSETAPSTSNAQRRVLYMAVAHLVKEKGFIGIDTLCMETLIEMMQALLVEIGQSSYRFCESSGRIHPIAADVIIAVANMGLPLNGLEAFARRPERQIISLPPVLASQKPLNLLSAGTKQSHPPYVPNYFPPLPDPHAYVRTPTHKQPVTEYEALREKAALQKRDIEKALVKFLCKTSETQSLFETDDNLYPLITPKPSFPPYMQALNPTDQIFDFEELEYHYQVANRTEDVTTKKGDKDGSDSENGDEVDDNPKKSRGEKDAKVENEIKPNSTTNKAILENPNIDNPYLRAATLPKRTKVPKEPFKPFS